MVEKLEGRLRWEKTSLGILVEIPARRSGMVALYAPLVVMWLVFASIHYWHLFAGPHRKDSEFTFQLIAIGVYAVGFCFFVCWLAWFLTNDTILTLDSDRMKIRHRVIGIDFVSHSFRNYDARNLRYVPPTPFWANKNEIDPRTSKIEFQSGGKTHTIASGITETEANALIGQMLTVYRFPNFRETRNAHPAR